jgi:DNA-directed RNA polymerase subunit RPC12/RpoP
MIAFTCGSCRTEVKGILDESGCRKCGSKDILKEYSSNKEWLQWWRDVGSKDRAAFYASRRKS